MTMEISNSNQNAAGDSMETALEKTGVGLYTYIMTGLAGFMVVAIVCITFSSSILVPTSACELQTTVAQQGLLAASPLIGTTLGGLFWGYLADTKGRRNMALVALIGAAVVNAIAALSVNWIMLLVMQLIASIFTSGVYSMAMSLLSESVPMTKRNITVLLVISIYFMAQGIQAVLAIPIIPLAFSYYIPFLGIYWNSWRTLMVIYSIPCLICATVLFFMHESPKFTHSRGDENRTLEILRAIHRINCGSSEEYQVKNVVRPKAEEPKTNLKPLFQSPLLKYTVIISTLYIFQQVTALQVWLPTIADQFFTILGTGGSTDVNLCGVLDSNVTAVVDPNEVPCSLNTTALLTVLVLGALQSTLNLIVSMVVDKVGRRNVVIIITATSGMSGLLVSAVPNAFASGALFLIQLMGNVVLGLYTAIAITLFPTHLRALGISVAITAGRIGTFSSIQILNILRVNNCELGFYLFSSLFIGTAVVAAFLPDDRTEPKRINQRN